MSQSLEEMISSKLVEGIRPFVMETVNTKLGDGRMNRLEDLVSELIKKMDNQSIVPEMLNIEQVERMTGMSKSSIYRRVNSREFPRSINCGGNTRRWRRSDILKYIDNLEYVDSMEVTA